ncbi:hypothetical protein I3760_15G018700 [Carya illinoinensis]|nr:hypothetical protein I3760_15G018700 [Carya illinoinensis]
MLTKERSVGMYKLSAYFLGRTTSDLPLDLVLPIVFLLIVYFMVGLKLSFASFSLTMLTVFLSVVAAQGLGLTIGAAFMDVRKATTVASIIVMAFMLSAGFFIQVSLCLSLFSRDNALDIPLELRSLTIFLTQNTFYKLERNRHSMWIGLH